MTHTIFGIDRNTVDDRLDSFHPQASSQWDALRHVRAREHGYFGGYTDDTEAGNALNIGIWAKRGIIGRGVLADIPAYQARNGTAWDPFANNTVSAETLRSVLDTQGVSLIGGDILCVRTGWLDAYRDLDRTEREAMAASPASAGLCGDDAMARWIWDHEIAAIVVDNPAVEAVPGDPSIGSLHRRLLPLLGQALGELFDLDDLAAHCWRTGRFEFLFTAVPLNLPAGVGSPANAVALF
jgi:kynurenine formamidase